MLVAAAMLALTSGCARLFTRPTRPGSADAAAIVAAATARERAFRGLRLTLSVRATAGPPAARLASPAYLAIDDPEHLRLQVLSPFGVTVLDLRTDGDAFTLTLPLRGETRSGRIDLAALAAGTTPDDERMIVALALLFRPKVEQGRCRSAGPGAIACTVASDLTATIRVDASLHVVREDYAGPRRRAAPQGRSRGVRGARTRCAPGADRHLGRLRADPALVIRVVKARRAAEKM